MHFFASTGATKTIIAPVEMCAYHFDGIIEWSRFHVSSEVNTTSLNSRLCNYLIAYIFVYTSDISWNFRPLAGSAAGDKQALQALQGVRSIGRPSN